MKWSPLLRWYEKEGRDLPWRRTRDPYRILVSEMMLQQTQVSRVLDFYKRWLKRFPTWHALARASNAEVVHAWAGLGYNRRGLMLRDIARTIAANRKHPQHPQTEAEWLKLKGIGPYTAAAVSSFAQGRNTIPIDTNIRRTLGRLLLAKPFPQPADDDRIRSRVTRYALRDTHFQALFDLAVSICKKDPDCEACPMRSQCPASKKFLSGRVRIPKRMIKKANEKKHHDKPFPDRIYRGRILTETRKHPKGIAVRELGPLIDANFQAKQDGDWLKHMIRRMEKDGFLRIERGVVRLA